MDTNALNEAKVIHTFFFKVKNAYYARKCITVIHYDRKGQTVEMRGVEISIGKCNSGRSSRVEKRKPTEEIVLNSGLAQGCPLVQYMVCAGGSKRSNFKPFAFFVVPLSRFL